MADFEYTPGPWKALKPCFGYQTIRQDPKDWDGHGYQLICTLPQSAKGTHYGSMFRANANLIASAPDLLEKAKALVEWVKKCEQPLSELDFDGDLTCPRREIKELEAVIAKATATS